MYMNIIDQQLLASVEQDVRSNEGGEIRATVY